METDEDLTRRVAVALQAAMPFSTVNGKHAQFPHHLITRGPKKAKTNLGELSLSEYIWGFMQIVKGKSPADEAVPLMSNHMEKIMEDAMTYEWEGSNNWMTFSLKLIDGSTGHTPRHSRFSP